MTEKEREPFQAHCWICPKCNDDHGRGGKFTPRPFFKLEGRGYSAGDIYLERPGAFVDAEAQCRLREELEAAFEKAVAKREAEAFRRGLLEAAKIVSEEPRSRSMYADSAPMVIEALKYAEKSIRAGAEEGLKRQRFATVFVNGSEVPTETKINGLLHLERNLDKCDAREKGYVLFRLCDDLLDHMDEIELGTVTLHLNGPLISWTATKKPNPTGAAQ